MSAFQWAWTRARAVGTSHLASGAGCDDFAACLELNSPGGQVFVAVVSDGAGSAEHSAVGSQIVCREFSIFARSLTRRGIRPSQIDATDVLECLDAIRDHIGAQATLLGSHPKAFAATLVGCIVDPESSAVIHVGDGACVYRMERHTDWHVASWPVQGEYAATTHFVTDSPAPEFALTIVEEPIDTIALFSDGLERLALDFKQRTAFAGFFNSMFNSFPNNLRGHNRKLSDSLKHFLQSPSVCQRTDDDKTLVLAQRVKLE